MDYPGEMKDKMDHAASLARLKFAMERIMADSPILKQIDESIFREMLKNRNGGVLPKWYDEGIGGA